MDNSKWGRLRHKISNVFGIAKEYSEEKEIKKGIKEKKEVLIFFISGREMKLERTIRPKVENVKYIYSRLTYRGAHQEYQYSSTETVEIMKLYQWDKKTNNWAEINLDKL